ncbi:MAG: KH domain-containing protein [Nanoarchaeota archaeon]|nr:KH domain-containing protein [Nanoarchaeota archaeon]MBU4124150.1 KH domain-containing protein [Nanoarchaeota archaeon]
MIESILIPKDRLGVIKHKKTREEVEKKLDVKLKFEENAIIIDGEGIPLFVAINIVKAIGRGFSPPKAFRLFDEDQSLEIIELDYSENKSNRIKSRIIGSEGKTREEIEKYTKASISIYGKTISIIGTREEINNAKEAIKMFMLGSEHITVYDFLRRLK